MYADKAKRIGLRIGLIVLAALLLAGGIALFSRASARDLREESAAAIEQAIRKNALQCYVVEGVYPPNLAYLQDNYGLQVNTDDFYIHYEAFAPNLPPTIKVTAKEK
jgi:hypothetical protein